MVSMDREVVSFQKFDLISPEAIMPIQHLKVEHLGSLNPRLHSDEVLIALASSAWPMVSMDREVVSFQKFSLLAHAFTLFSLIVP